MFAVILVCIIYKNPKYKYMSVELYKMWPAVIDNYIMQMSNYRYIIIIITGNDSYPDDTDNQAGEEQLGLATVIWYLKMKMITVNMITHVCL